MSRTVTAGILVAVGLAGGMLWQLTTSGRLVDTTHKTPAAGTLDFAVTMADESLPSPGATLATLPAQRLVLQLITYGPPVPHTGLDSSGGPASLSDIFRDANIDIATELPPARSYPFDSEYITQAELSALASEPHSSGAGWKVTGFLLKRGTQPGDYGTIFPQGSRQRFAVFADEIGSQNKVLRTIAHELGHTLNLFHDDGDGSCCIGTAGLGTSLMNQDRCLNQQAWRYSFGVKELDHLRNHPAASVNPNGPVAFGVCTTGHQRQC